MRLSTRGRYAVMAMVELASRARSGDRRGGAGRPVSLAEIADAQLLSLAYLEQLFARLRRGGLVASVRGPGGGYMLDCAPEKTLLSQLFELLGGNFAANGCGLDGCKNRPCFIGEMMDELTRAFVRYLSSRTLADFTAYYDDPAPVKIKISVVPGPSGSSKVA